MRRRLLAIAVVALLAHGISRTERAAGSGNGHSDWVRTAQGWAPRWSVDVRQSPRLPEVHPGLVAAFQLGTSTLALLAFSKPR